MGAFPMAPPELIKSNECMDSGSRQKIEELEDLLFQGLLEKPTWSTFLGRLPGIVGGVESNFIIIPKYRYIDEVIVFGNCSSERNLAAFIEYLAKGDLAFDAPIILDDVEEDIGLWHLAAGVRLFLDADRSIYLFTRSSHDSLQLASEWREILYNIHPLLTKIVKFYLLIADFNRRLLTVEYALRVGGTGVILVDSNGYVININEIAKSLIDECGVLTISEGYLRANRLSDANAILNIVRKKAEQQGPYIDIDCYDTLSLSRDDDPLPLTIIVRPGPPYAPASAPMRRTATIIMRDPSRRLKMATLHLERLFNLSRAEARLAGLLVEGLSLEESAVRLNVSRHTVRSQIKSIFIKTGTNRQSDLVRILINSVAAFAQGPEEI